MSTRKEESRPRPASPEAADTVRVGLIGKGIQRSKSPAMHEAEAAAQGFRCVYELIDLDERGVDINALPGLLSEAEERGFAGVNVTYPCKQAVIPLLTGLSDEARAIGAVNTVHFEPGARTGYNTDAWGFAESFRRGLGDASLERVAQIGAGGAGAATGYAMLGLGARHLRIFDVDLDRATSLVRSLVRHFPDREISAVDEIEEAVGDAQGLVHATPTGMASHRGSAVPATLLRPDLWVAD
ncbi:MAG TPA: shikimate dehydrogenase, partial [Gemmatimonadaceae bacterium]|nr:shikimate dehydrogenase [Gemmatimonadaceae bacterium]